MNIEELIKEYGFYVGFTETRLRAEAFCDFMTNDSRNPFKFYYFYHDGVFKIYKFFMEDIKHG